MDNYIKDLELLRIELVNRNIISKDDTIGTKQFVQYAHILKYLKNLQTKGNQ